MQKAAGWRPGGRGSRSQRIEQDRSWRAPEREARGQLRGRAGVQRDGAARAAGEASGASSYVQPPSKRPGAAPSIADAQKTAGPPAAAGLSAGARTVARPGASLGASLGLAAVKLAGAVPMVTGTT